jgi:hypothetical protein
MQDFAAELLSPGCADLRPLQCTGGCWRFDWPASFRTVKRHKYRAPADLQSAAVARCARLGLAGKLNEPKAARLEALLTEFLVATPQRLWQRFWPRN